MLRFITHLVLFLLSSVATADEILLACIDERLNTAALKLTQSSDEKVRVESYSNLEKLQFNTRADQHNSTLMMNLDEGLVILHEEKLLRLNALFVDGTIYQMQCNEVPTAEINVGEQVNPEKDSINSQKQCEGNLPQAGIINFDAQLHATNQYGDVIRLGDIVTKPTLFYFGYTFCPDVCPLDTFRNDQVVTGLKSLGIDAQQVFISVDVERDTPSVISNFISNFENNTLGLTGDEKQISELTQAMRVFYRKQSTEDEYFLIDHSTFTYFVLPDKGVVDYFGRETSTEQVIESVMCQINSSR